MEETLLLMQTANAEETEARGAELAKRMCENTEIRIIYCEVK